MASIGTGYDLSATTYSPDGRVFQVEYAAKATETKGYVYANCIIIFAMSVGFLIYFIFFLVDFLLSYGHEF